MSELVRFGRFEFDLHSEALFREGQPINLQEKPRRILKILLENQGNVVSRQALIDHLWPDGTHVDFDNNLNASMRKLRETLGDSADKALYVRTIPRKGYGFVAPIQKPQADANIRPQPTPPSKLFRILLLVTTAFALGLTLASFWPKTQPKTRIMLGFLPLRILGESAELQVLGDGLHEELIVHTGNYAPEELGVIAGTSVRTYRNTAKTVLQIGDELGADFLVEGTLQKESTRIRMTAQLIRVRDQAQVWSKVYHRDMTQLFQLRRDIGLDVTRHLAEFLTEKRQPPTDMPLVKGDYQDYLKARYHMTQNKIVGFEMAAQLLEKLLKDSPEFSPGHALLGEAYTLQAIYGAQPTDQLYQRGHDAALKALERNPKNSLALATVGYNKLYGHWDWLAAGDYFKQALALTPGDAKTQSAAAAWFSVVGRHAEAVEAAERAQLIDPLSLSVNHDLAWYYYYAGDMDRALKHHEYIRELDPQNQTYCAMLGHWVKGEQDKAFSILQTLLPASEAVQTAFSKASALGADAANDWLVNMLRKNAGDQNNYLLANRLTALGKHDEAMEVIQAGWQKRMAWAAYAPVDPGFQDLFSTEDFQQLVREMGLPVILQDNRYVPNPSQQ